VAPVAAAVGAAPQGVRAGAGGGERGRQRRWGRRRWAYLRQEYVTPYSGRPL
jgi:hypothetical protein